MENLGFITLNGRTERDIPGRFTYISKNWTSTMDLANINTIEKAEFLLNKQTLTNSNHSICTIQFKQTFKTVTENKNEYNDNNLKYNIHFPFDINLKADYQAQLSQINIKYPHNTNVDKLAQNLESAI